MKRPSNYQTVLIVDDDEDIRESIAMVLEIGGIHSSKARDAEDALRLLAMQPPGLILLDCNLPGASGEDLASRLRNEGTSIPIVGMSAEDRRATMLAAGATTFLDKPFNPNELIILVQSLLYPEEAVPPQTHS